MDRLAHALKWQQENRAALDAKERAEKKCNSARGAKYVRERRKRDVHFRLMLALRSRLGMAMRSFGFAKHTKTLQMLGCSVSELKRHLESLWKPGMCWENYGEWHIDHKRPCVSFDLTDKKQQLECFNYLNLQPLWAKENFRKSGKYNVNTQCLHL